MSSSIPKQFDSTLGQQWWLFGGQDGQEVTTIWDAPDDVGDEELFFGMGAEAWALQQVPKEFRYEASQGDVATPSAGFAAWKAQNNWVLPTPKRLP